LKTAAGIYTRYVKITFRGAAQTVTGSMHEIETGGKRLLLDCGLYQGRRKEAEAINRTFPWPGGSVDAVLLSHAHIDHSGNLPNLVRSGFAGPIYTTSATTDLCSAMLQDSAFLQEKDALFLNKRNARRQRLIDEDLSAPVEALYTVEDAKRTLQHFRTINLHQRTEVAPGVFYTSYEAGHMLGSTCLTVEAEGVRLLFSGDVGRKGLPIIRDPENIPEADYLIMESTYGDRLHQPIEAVAGKLTDIVRRTASRGGKIVAPSFAVGRTQQLVVLLHELIEQNKIPAIPIFVDSPLAVNVTDVFRKHPECYDEELQEHFSNGEDPFGFKRLRYIREVSESKALNDLRGPFLVISASGMCEAGRVIHHLRNTIEDPKNTVLITGFQAEHTLGRKIVDKWAEVPIFGEPIRLRAEVTKINELSGHADQHELLTWMKPLTKSVKKVFLVHGEPLQQAALAKAIGETYGLPVEIPKRGDSFDLARPA
jgi:metallo-beta-lactamase family protein